MNSLAWKVALTSTLALCVSNAAAQSSYDLRSANKRIEVRIRTANGVRYDVLLKGRMLLQDSSLSMNIDSPSCARNLQRFARTTMNCASIWKAATRWSFAPTTKEQHIVWKRLALNRK